MCHTRELAFQISKEYERFSKYMPAVKVLGWPPLSPLFAKVPLSDTHLTAHHLLYQVGVFFGGLSIKKDEEVLKRESPHVVVGTPGRILALSRNKSLNLRHIKHFILDECDKMLEQLGKDSAPVCRSAPIPHALLELVKLFLCSWLKCSLHPHLHAIVRLLHQYYSDAPVMVMWPLCLCDWWRRSCNLPNFQRKVFAVHFFYFGVHIPSRAQIFAVYLKNRNFFDIWYLFYTADSKKSYFIFATCSVQKSFVSLTEFFPIINISQLCKMPFHIQMPNLIKIFSGDARAIYWIKIEWPERERDMVQLKNEH